MPCKSLRFPTGLLSGAAAFLLLMSCSSDNSTSDKSSTNKSWEGTWELQVTYTEAPITLVLRPDQKVYLMTTEPGTDKEAVFELPLTKVSDKTELPKNIKPISISDSLKIQAAKAREAAAQSELGAINRAQQAYRLENPTFAISNQELQLGRFNDESFDIEIVSGDANRAYATATSKRSDTRSFSGVVTVKDGITNTYICATESASQTPPPINCEP